MSMSCGRDLRTGPVFGWRVAAAIACATVTVAAASCGGQNASAPATTAASAPAARAVTIASFRYSPATITVAAGTRLTFDNRDDAAHTATADDGSFDSGTIAVGARRGVALARAGTHAYHCAFHPFMHGTVIVR
jgi:plastocyanin